MDIKNMNRLCLWILFTMFPVVVAADTGYVTDKVLAGLHQDKTTESVIIKVVPTGTPLEILKREGELTRVKDPDGISGWINNSYLIDAPPAQTLLQEAQAKADQLEVELENYKLQNDKSTSIITNQDAEVNSEEIKALRNENTELKQQSKSDQLKVGELQAQLAELRNQMTKIADGATDSNKIEQLKEENLNLQRQLDNMQTNTTSNAPTDIMVLDWQRMIIYIFVALVAGIALGIYLLDLAHRRRHGGYRVK